MDDIEAHVPLVFICCIIATFGFLFFGVKLAAKKSNLPTILLIGLIFWIALIGALSFSGFFLNFESRPPRVALVVAPALMFIATLFILPRSRDFIRRMPIATLTHIHLVRIPVEIVLWWLFIAGTVPEAITFEGTNYDILVGITAPFAAIFLLGKKNRHTIAAIIWNLLSLGLLANVVVRAVAATPYFMDSSAAIGSINLAMFYYPFIYLPLFIVPAVLFAHLASLYQLIFVPQDKY